MLDIAGDAWLSVAPDWVLWSASSGLAQGAESAVDGLPMGASRPGQNQVDRVGSPPEVPPGAVRSPLRLPRGSGFDPYGHPVQELEVDEWADALHCELGHDHDVVRWEQVLNGFARFAGTPEISRVAKPLKPRAVRLLKHIRWEADPIQELGRLLAATLGLNSTIRKPSGLLLESTARTSVLAQRTDHVVDLIRRGHGESLLATGSHVPGWIAPEVLAERVKGRRLLDDLDLAIALLRLPPTPVDDAVDRLRDQHGVGAQLVRYALGDAETATLPEGVPQRIMPVLGRTRARFSGQPEFLCVDPSELTSNDLIAQLITTEFNSDAFARTGELTAEIAFSSVLAAPGLLAHAGWKHAQVAAQYAQLKLPTLASIARLADIARLPPDRPMTRFLVGCLAGTKEAGHPALACLQRHLHNESITEVQLTPALLDLAPEVRSLARLARHLDALANSSTQARTTILRSTQQTLPKLLALPRSADLLQIMGDHLRISGSGVSDPEARHCLEQLRGSSKATSLAQQILNLPAR